MVCYLVPDILCLKVYDIVQSPGANCVHIVEIVRLALEERETSKADLDNEVDEHEADNPALFDVKERVLQSTRSGHTQHCYQEHGVSLANVQEGTTQVAESGNTEYTRFVGD